MQVHGAQITGSQFGCSKAGLWDKHLHRVASLALPAMMLAETLRRMNVPPSERRPDLLYILDMAMAVPFAGLDELSISRCAKLVSETSDRVLRDLSPDDPRDGLCAICHLFVVMIAEGLWADVKNQAVLTALLLLEDMKVPGGEWRYNERVAQLRGKELLLLLQREGFYKHRLVDNPVVATQDLVA